MSMFVEANGISMRYELSGEGEVVTLIHSLALDLDSWWLQVPVLEEGYRVLRYDVRGHGKSSKPAGPYSIDMLAEDLYQLLYALGIGRTHLVGLSMGGMISQAFTLAHPSMVGSLVLCDTSSGYTAEQRQAFEQRAELAEREGMEPMVQATVERWFTPAFRETAPDVVARIVGTIRANDPAAYAATSRAIGRLALTERISAIQRPTLVVVGEQDPGTPPEMAREIHRRIAGSRLDVLPNAAHLVPVEKASIFNGLVVDFLRQT